MKVVSSQRLFDIVSRLGGIGLLQEDKYPFHNPSLLSEIPIEIDTELVEGGSYVAVFWNQQVHLVGPFSSMLTSRLVRMLV